MPKTKFSFDTKTHVNMMASNLLDIQENILSISNNGYIKEQIGIDIMTNIILSLTQDITTLKLREMCWHLIKTNTLTEIQLEAFLKSFMLYQQELARLIKIEGSKIVKQNAKKFQDENKDFYSELLSKLPDGEKIH